MSRTDRKFIEFVVGKISKSLPLTTRQIDLANRLIVKHSRQLLSHGIKLTNTTTVQWCSPTIPSILDSTLTVDETSGLLVAWWPFSDRLIKLWRRDVGGKWMANVGWCLPNNIPNFRKAYEFMKTHCTFVKISPCLQERADFFEKQRRREFIPSMRPLKERVYVFAASESLMSALPDNIDATPQVVWRLCHLGVSIDPRIRRGIRKEYGRVIETMLTRFHNTIHHSDTCADQIIQFCELVGIKYIVSVPDQLISSADYFDAIRVQIRAKTNLVVNELQPDSTMANTIIMTPYPHLVGQLMSSFKTIYYFPPNYANM